MNNGRESGVILPFVLLLCFLMMLMLEGMLTLVQREPRLLHDEMVSLYQRARLQKAIDEGWQFLEESDTPLYFQHADRTLVPVHNSVGVSADISPSVHNAITYWSDTSWCRGIQATSGLRETTAQNNRKSRGNDEYGEQLRSELHCTRFELSAREESIDTHVIKSKPSIWRNQMVRLIHGRKARTGHLRMVQGGIELLSFSADQQNVERVLIPLYWRLLTEG